MANSGGNETGAFGGDVIANNTGNGDASGGNGTGGAAEANGGIAISGDAKVSNIAFVKQESEQKMEVEDNDKWLSFTFGHKKKRHSY